MMFPFFKMKFKNRKKDISKSVIRFLDSLNNAENVNGNRYFHAGWEGVGEGANSKSFLSPFWKGIYSKRKEFASFGSKFFFL